MRALIVYAHPKPTSFTAAVRDVIVQNLADADVECRVTDLYARGFDPILSDPEWSNYEDTATNQNPVQQDVDDLIWCDTLIFVYPTWWYGLPAILKGWLDRVMVPGIAFKMPDETNNDIRPGLTNITHMGLFTTCGASWWLTQLVGAPGKRTLLRGVRLICAKRCKTSYAAHHLMDSSTTASRAKHLAKVARKMDRMVAQCGRAPVRPRVVA
ncbi:MAG: NAD(P)H dehydrogenase (quinone) [Paracoccaceae bacterium]|jgi:NAD(P)H dehydrogenase (quinone)